MNNSIPKQKKSKYTKNQLPILLSIVFFDSVALFLIIPIMPTLLAELTGGSVADNSVWAGWLTVSFAIMQFIFAPIVGLFSDKFGRKKIFIICAITFIINFLIMAITNNIWLLFVGRILTGMAGASLATVQASIADISNSNNRVKNFGKVYGVFGLGMIAGPVIGGLLGAIGTRIPFWFSVVIWTINLIVIIFVLQETLTKPKHKKINNPLKQIFTMFKYSGFSWLFSANILNLIAFQAIIIVSAFYTKGKFAWQEVQIGFSMGFFGITYALTQIFLVNRIHSILGTFKTLLFGLSCTICGFIVLGLAPNGYIYYIGLFIFSIGGIGNSSMTDLFIVNVKDDEQGVIAGVLTSVRSLAEIMGPPIIAYIFYFTLHHNLPLSGGVTFLVSAMIAAISIIFYWCGYNRLAVKK